MSSNHFATSFAVQHSPQEVFAAITKVRGWWSGEVEGDPERLGAEFTYRVPGVHSCRMRVTEHLPGKRMVWRVLDGDIAYVGRKTEWNDTEIHFDLSQVDGRTEVHFSHQGLIPALECFDACSTAWTSLVVGNLQNLIRTGQDQPSPFA